MNRTRQVCLLLCLILPVASAEAHCPFCEAVKPTWSQLRERASEVLLAETAGGAGQSDDFRVHQVLKGTRFTKEAHLTLDLPDSFKPGSLVLLLAEGEANSAVGSLTWTALPTTELSLVYFVRAPSLREPAAERLRYFARFLEHADARIAEDAYYEFGHAPYSDVAAAADNLPVEKLRTWLDDPKVLASRKGFYGLALGLAGTRDQQRESMTFLRLQIENKPAKEFRTGFDGVLGGYLIGAGEPAIDAIEARFINNPMASDADLRQVLAALRFYREFGQGIPIDRQRRALRGFLVRPEFAAAAIVDLARWEDWQALPQVMAIYQRKPAPDAPTKRAIVGYLLAADSAQANAELARLRQLDPAGIKEAEQYLALFGTGAQKQ